MDERQPVGIWQQVNYNALGSSMAQTQAERAKAYRDRKRDESTGGSVTPVTETAQVSVTVLDPDSNAPNVRIGDRLASVEAKPHVDLRTTPDLVCLTTDEVDLNATTEPVISYAPRTNPELLNTGPHMTADELHTHKTQNKLSKYHNRVPIPGDSDYSGCGIGTEQGLAKI